MSGQTAVEALELAFAPTLFKGLPDAGWNKGIVIADLDLARQLAFDQNLPADYRIWLDVIEEYRRQLRANPKFDEAHQFVSDRLGDLQQQHASQLLDYRKRKVRKMINTVIDDFRFSDAREDAYFVLSTVAINRYLDGYLSEPIVENLFDIYQDGGWPCGMKDERIVVFDPKSIMVPSPS